EAMESEGETPSERPHRPRAYHDRSAPRALPRSASGGLVRKALQRCALLGVLAFAPCHALAAGGQDWSMVTGQTIGGGATSVHLQAAWPGISLSVIHGASPGFDFGGIFTYNYNYEGDVRASFPGIKLQAFLKGTLLKTPRYNLGVTFAPG